MPCKVVLILITVSYGFEVSYNFIYPGFLEIVTNTTPAIKIWFVLLAYSLPTCTGCFRRTCHYDLRSRKGYKGYTSIMTRPFFVYKRSVHLLLRTCYPCVFFSLICDKCRHYSQPSSIIVPSILLHYNIITIKWAPLFT